MPERTLEVRREGIFHKGWGTVPGERALVFCLAVHVLRHARLFCCVFPRRVVYYGYYQLS